MTVTLDREVRVVKDVQGEVFYDGNLPNALREAQKYAGKEGYVASMPQLLQGRVKAPNDDGIWADWFTVNSEENVGKTAQGKPVVIAVHGGGIFSSPERIERAYSDKLVNYAGKLDDKEIKDLLAGKLPDGTQIPVYSFSQFKKGISGLPRQYAVVMDFDEVRQTTSGYQNADGLKDNPLTIVRAGGVEQAATYIERAKEKHNTKNYGNWHPFGRKYPDQCGVE